MGHNWMSKERGVFEEWRLPRNSAERAKEAENDRPMTLTWWIVFWVPSHYPPDVSRSTVRKANRDPK
jgi:hypothetical protein